jgi:ATP-dependent DNA helicase RecG
MSKLTDHMNEEIQIKTLHSLMSDVEDEHLEFKEAKEGFDFKRLVKYCVALANECSGKLILGVTNKKPRNVVGTNAFKGIEKLKQQSIDIVHLRIEISEVAHPNGRVLLIDVPLLL